jgi:Flp pilus assembly protein TadG
LRSSSKKAQSLAEFAISLPVILLVLLGIAVLFHLFAVLVTTHNAASEGGRAAQVWQVDGTTSCESVATEAIKRTTPFFKDGVDQIILTNCSGSLVDRIPAGTLIGVKVIVNWQPLFFSTLLKSYWDPPATIPLTAEVKVRHE